MEPVIWIVVLAALLAFPAGRALLKLWVLLSIVLVWLLDSTARDVLGD
jgi:hypothetical protein